VFHYAVMFLVVGVLAVIFGFSDISVTVVEVVRIIFLVCCAAFVVLPATGVMRRRADDKAFPHPPTRSSQAD